MNNGWIKLHRKILDWEWYDDPNTFRLFLHLLLIANHEDKKYRGVLVKRGSVVTGRIKLAEELGLTEQQVRTALGKLKSTSEITSHSTNQFTVITVINYDKYQQDNQPITGRITNEQPTNNHKQELKNVRIKEVKNIGSRPNLTNSDLEGVAKRYNVPLSFVRVVYERMVNWHEENPARNRKANWLATLRNWVIKDSLQVKHDHAKQTSDLAL